MKYVLTIAGSDSIGGAGIQADIKTITTLGCHALSVVTALTAQNSMGILAIHPVPSAFISRQIEAIMEDIVPDAVKVGMVFTRAAIGTVAKLVREYRISCLVVDPILKSSTGRDLLDPDAVMVMKELLFPMARVVTPNVDEAEVLTGMRVRNLKEMDEASKKIKTFGPAVVIKGGHLAGDSVDLLFDGKKRHLFRGTRILAPHTHGTGCVFSSALTSFLAMGQGLERATKKAHDFVREAIKKGYACGRGSGSVNPARI